MPDFQTVTKCREINEKVVTKSSCDTKHKSTWRLLSALLVLLVGFLCVAGWACWAGYSASAYAGKVDQKVEVSIRRTQERGIRIDQTLMRLENQLAKQSEKIDDLWRKNGGNNP